MELRQLHTLGTSTGLGERLPRLLAELGRRAPGRMVELVRVPAAERLRQVVDGALDAALLRGTTSHPGVRLEHVWSDAILAALPAEHPVARADPLALASLRALPLRLPDRDRNPPLVDLVVGACRAVGFEPRLAPALDDQDMLAAIAGAEPTWTVYYAAQAEVLAGMAAGVAFRPLADPPLRMPTLLALPAARGEPELDALVDACRAVA